MRNEEAETATPVRPVMLEEMPAGAGGGPALAEPALGLVQDVRVRLTVCIGRARITIGELFALREGGTLKLDKLTSEPVDVLLDEKLVARGELVVADDSFGVRVTEVAVRP